MDKYLDYLDVANSNFIYGLAIFVIIFIIFQSLIFMRKAYKQGLKIGMDKKILFKTIKSSMVFSIVPSIPIVIALMAMAPVLGIPFPWIRLSIIGSSVYELLSANIGAQSMGISGLGGDGYTAVVFANSLWVMSVGIIWGLVASIIGLKKYQNRIQKSRGKDSKWTEIFVLSLYFGMISVFIGQPIVEGGIALYTMIFSATVMGLITFIINKFKLKRLGDFALSISMVLGMVFAAIIG